MSRRFDVDVRIVLRLFDSNIAHVLKASSVFVEEKHLMHANFYCLDWIIKDDDTLKQRLFCGC